MTKLNYEGELLTFRFTDTSLRCICHVCKHEEEFLGNYIIENTNPSQINWVASTVMLDFTKQHTHPTKSGE